MKNKKLNELINPTHIQPSLEEEQTFIDNLTRKIKKDKEELEKWLSDFKIKHGIQDETN